MARSILITGATSGIGYHVAEALARAGESVLITGRNAERGEEAVAAIRRSAGHGRVSFLPCDHLTIGANQQLAAQVAKSLDRLDVLINNVGRVFPRREETSDGYEATLALCFLGPVALTRTLLPLLRAADHARIVNVASSAYKMWHGDPFEDVQSRQSYVGIKTHARAKLFNVISTLALAHELQETGVTVNATNPGAAWTPGVEQLTPEAVPAWRYVWPIVRFFQRRGSAAKAADTPLWLASDPAAAHLSGTFVEKRRPHRPKVALDPQNQSRTAALAECLITSAPTGVARYRSTTSWEPATGGDSRKWT